MSCSRAAIYDTKQGKEQEARQLNSRNTPATPKLVLVKAEGTADSVRGKSRAKSCRASQRFRLNGS